MRTTSYLALSRQAALERQMATVANNLANATTTGYRAEHMVFEETLHRAGRQRVAFVQDVGLARDLSPGPIAQTGNPLDLAIEGSGYLAFATDGGTRYGRARPAGGRPRRPAGRFRRAGAARRWRQRHPPGRRRDARSRSRATGRFPAATGRSPGSASMASPTSRRCAVPATGCSPRAMPHGPAEGMRIVQGALEGSNVQPVLEMTTMLASVRAFEGAQRLLDTEHELERQAIERAGRAAG